MKCKFCQQECNVQQIDSEISGFPASKGFTCDNHKYPVMHLVVSEYEANLWWKLNEVWHFHFSIPKNDCVYQFSWSIPNENYPTFDFSISKYVGKNGLVIFDLNIWPPNITPENAEQKMKIWLAIA